MGPRCFNSLTMLWIAWIACAVGAAPAIGAMESRERPNIIVILMDDMGWRDVGFAGNSFVETPQLDALAKRGVVFKQAYASAPNCAPTRACLLSGQVTPRHGVYTVVDPKQSPGSPWQKILAAESRSDLPTEKVTIAESLRDNGYATAFFGMWNLGRGRLGPTTPSGQGFSKVVFPETVGFGKDAYFDAKGNYLSDRLTDEVIQFVEEKRSSPFFVYYADHAVHAPYDPKPDLLAKYKSKAERSSDRRNDPAYAATIEAVDRNIERIVKKLESLQLLDDTILIFTSDNGGTPQYTAPLRGSKGQLYEGGIRVPMFVYWTKLGDVGRIENTPVASIDIFPTCLELTGTSIPKETPLDGVSLVPLLNKGERLARSQLFWHFPCYVGRATPASAIRDGDYKLIEFFEDGGSVELYNLNDDPNETKDLSQIEKDVADRLLQSLHEWQEETGAALPRTLNPDYDPKASRPRGQDRSQSQNAKGK